MTRIEVRSLKEEDVSLLAAIEERLLGPDAAAAEAVHHRLCCRIFNDTCFVALADDIPIAYLLGFVRDGQAYCTTLVAQKGREAAGVVPRLIVALLEAVSGDASACWFTLRRRNLSRQALDAAFAAAGVAVRSSLVEGEDERDALDQHGVPADADETPLAWVDRRTLEAMRPHAP